MTRGMKRTVLAFGIAAFVPSTAYPAETMLQWCAKAYPTRLDWCKSQYPGTLDATGPNQAAAPTAGTTPIPASPPTSSKQVSNLEAMLPKISGRPGDKVPTFNIGADNHFNTEGQTITKALYASLKYAGMSFDDEGDCVEQNPGGGEADYLDCAIYDRNSEFHISAIQPKGSNTVDKVEISYTIEDGSGASANFFNFGIVADSLSRMLDPDLIDDQRADVFAKIGESYFSSGRTEGFALGKQVKYVLTEEGGIFSLVMRPLSSDGGERGMSARSVNPVLAFAASLDRSDAVKPDPLDASEVQAKVAEKREIVRSLLAELDIFRYSRRFKQVGFAECCEFNKWLSKVTSLQQPDEEPLKFALFRAHYVGAVFGLVNMGFEYMHTDGKDTAETIVNRKDVMSFLNTK